MPSLGDFLRDAARGVFPPADGGVTFVPPDRDGVEAVVALTGHAVVATTLPPPVVLAAGADGFGGATLPLVTTTLAGSGAIDTLDVVLLATGTGGGTLPRREVPEDHPRLTHARRWRSDVTVFGDSRGEVLLSRGLGGLPELSYEVGPERRGRGFGRALLAEGLALVPAGETVVIASAPGNAASLRAILALGALPVGSVQLVRPSRDD